MFGVTKEHGISFLPSHLQGGGKVESSALPLSICSVSQTDSYPCHQVY